MGRHMAERGNCAGSKGNDEDAETGCDGAIGFDEEEEEVEREGTDGAIGFDDEEEEEREGTDDAASCCVDAGSFAAAVYSGAAWVDAAAEKARGAIGRHRDEVGKPLRTSHRWTRRLFCRPSPTSFRSPSILC